MGGQPQPDRQKDQENLAGRLVSRQAFGINDFRQPWPPKLASRADIRSWPIRELRRRHYARAEGGVEASFGVEDFLSTNPRQQLYPWGHLPQVVGKDTSNFLRTLLTTLMELWVVRVGTVLRLNNGFWLQLALQSPFISIDRGRR